MSLDHPNPRKVHSFGTGDVRLSLEAFYERIRDFVANLSDYVEDTETFALQDFGGGGDCGPSSAAGVLRAIGFQGFNGDASALRNLMVEHARATPELLESMSEFIAHTGFEVRGRSGLRRIFNPEEYLQHIIQPGSHFDALAWNILIGTFPINVVIHRVSPLIYLPHSVHILICFIFLYYDL
jgi:hypothetical protein